MTFDQKLEILKQILYAKNHEFAIYLLNNSFLTCCILEALNDAQDIVNHFDNLKIPDNYITLSLIEQKLVILKKYVSPKQYQYIFSLESNLITDLNNVDSLKEILNIIKELPKNI